MSRRNPAANEVCGIQSNFDDERSHYVISICISLPQTPERNTALGRHAKRRLSKAGGCKGLPVPWTSQKHESFELTAKPESCHLKVTVCYAQECSRGDTVCRGTAHWQTRDTTCLSLTVGGVVQVGLHTIPPETTWSEGIGGGQGGCGCGVDAQRARTTFPIIRFHPAANTFGGREGGREGAGGGGREGEARIHIQGRGRPNVQLAIRCISLPEELYRNLPWEHELGGYLPTRFQTPFNEP